MKFSYKETGRSFLTRTILIYTLLICFAAVMISLMIYSASTGFKIALQYAPLVETAMEIKIEATTAHLWFEEIITGDRSLKIEKVWAHFDRSRKYAQAMLEQVENPKGEFRSLKNVKLRQTIKKTIKQIREVKSIAEERWNAQPESNIGSDIDQHFDEIFSQFLKTVDDVKTRLQEQIADQLNRFRLLQTSLIIASVLFCCLVGFFLKQYESKLILDRDSLKEKEEKFRLAFKTSPDAININRLNDGMYIDINEGFTKIMGYHKDEVMGKSSLTLNIWKNPDDRQKLIQGLTKAGYFDNLEAEFISKNGKIKNGLMSARILKINNETVILSVTRDITDRKKVEKIIQESEVKYRTLFEKSNDAIFIVERDTGRYIDANMAALELTGRTLIDLKQQTTHNLTPKNSEDRLKTIQQAHETMDLGKVAYHRPDDSTRTAMLSIVPLTDNHVIGIAKDITQELIQEKQLRQSQKMEAIGTLAGGIAHDFNNILSGIFGYAQIIENNYDDSKNVKNNILEIKKGAKRATDLVQQILTFSRQAEHKKNRFKLCVIVKETIKFLRSSIPASIKIDETISSEKMILADPTQVHQVIMNLCTNAYHSMQTSGGILTVALTDCQIEKNDPLIHSSMHPPGQYIELEISDTGHGMDSETIGRIFDPYFTTKGPGKGTGLGLSVVGGIVKRQNGFIKIFSQMDQGSTFRIFWPVSEKGNSIHFSAHEKETKPLTGNEQILMVDDEPDILSTSRSLLERQGYTVATTQDALSALSLFEKNPTFFDLIITDMTMPHMTGIELSRKILTIRKDIPIILCTGYDEGLTESASTEIGIKKFLQKPVRPNILFESVRHALDA